MKLDATLLSALFGKSKEFAIGSPLPERVLLARLKEKLTLHTRLTRQSPEVRELQRFSSRVREGH